MWVITQVQMHLNDKFERAVAGLVEAEAAACPCCRAVLEATGALPTRCPNCGRVRGLNWQDGIEERASRELARVKG